MNLFRPVSAVHNPKDVAAQIGNHGLCGLPEESAHGKSPKCLGGTLGDLGGILQRSLLTNATTILVDKKLADFLINKYNQEIQIIPIELVCKDTILSDKYFLINSLHTENIIDEQESERIYIDENTSFLSSDNMKLNDNSLKVIGIGRHNNPACSTDLFFSDELIFELHEHGFDKGFIFA